MTEKPIVLLSEVQKHNTRNDIWMIIDGGVYDVTKFLDEHPGGEEVMLEQAGMESTEAFEQIGHSDDARELMKAMYVGPLEKIDSKTVNELKQAKETIAVAAATEDSAKSTGLVGSLMNWLTGAK